MSDTLSRWILGSAFLSLGFGLQASSFVIGEPPLIAIGNCDPFGCPEFFGLGTYQQVYAYSAFPGATTITGLSFYSDQVPNGAEPAGGTFTLSLSYTNSGPGDLNLTNPNANISSGSQVYFAGSLPFLAQNTLDFGGAPFAYNPALGNLLLTVTVTNPSDRALTLYLDQASLATQTTNAYFGTFDGQPISGGNDMGGLMTGFTVVSSIATPEPGSLLLMLAGAAALIAYRRGSHMPCKRQIQHY
jgi:hypothetical protein